MKFLSIFHHFISSIASKLWFCDRYNVTWLCKQKTSRSSDLISHLCIIYLTKYRYIISWVTIFPTMSYLGLADFVQRRFLIFGSSSLALHLDPLQSLITYLEVERLRGADAARFAINCSYLFIPRIFIGNEERRAVNRRWLTVNIHLPFCNGERVGDSETSWYVVEENDVARRKELATRITCLQRRGKR